MRRAAIALIVVLALLATLPLVGRIAHLPTRLSSNPHKVFVILGFHTNFYHSWRGDTPDEAGFGTDIRIVREILRILDDANRRGLDARGYWESDAQFTLESILPAHAPDIIDAIRRRVASGHDEFLVAPYNNGFFSAMTEDEVRATLRWAVRNPWGSGAEDLFGRALPIVRPQEAMFTPGLIPLLLDEGMEGLILPYSTYPFTSFSNFVSPLPPEQRFGVTWLRTEPDGPRIALFPSVSPGDVVDFVSLEKWMLTLRDLQRTGAVDHDLVIHINFDADAESWLPLPLPSGLRWLPNTGGLQEYIAAVNKYSWAEFTTPGEFLASRTPQGEVIVRQDTADGAWDGYYSWSEKHDSHEVWTQLQQSRLYERQARALATRLPGASADSLHETYFSGPHGSFLQRIRALSTTHFGMSTPMVNEERFAAAVSAASGARQRALAALRSAARARAALAGPGRADALYAFEIEDHPDAPEELPVRIPLLLPAPAAIEVVDGDGVSVPHALVENARIGRSYAAQLILPIEAARRPQPLRVHRILGETSHTPAGAPLRSATLGNERLRLTLSAENGVDSLVVDGVAIGGPEFLTSFLTYRDAEGPATAWARDWRIEIPEGETHGSVQRVRIQSSIPLPSAEQRGTAELSVTFTLPDGAAYILADVAVAYPYTEKRDVLDTPQQKLRKLIDRRWIEVGPFQLHPQLPVGVGETFQIWRSNYLDVVSSYDLNYGEINPRNATLDSFNHHITGAWVAVTGGGAGLLLGQDSTVRTAPAFAPMRLRENNGRPQLWINPFGSYFGEQMDYSHMGGAGLGRDLAVMIGPAFRPNGPSFNGQQSRFRLLLAPFVGDEPPASIQAAARSTFTPPAVSFLRTPAGIEALVPEDIEALIDARRVEHARTSRAPVQPPRAFLVSPTERAVDLVWDPAHDLRVDRFDIEWRSTSDETWQTIDVVNAHRFRIAPIENGSVVECRVRARTGDIVSPWTDAQTVTVGPIGEQPIRSFAEHVPLRFLLRLVRQVLIHVLTV